MKRWRVDSEGVYLCPPCAEQDGEARAWPAVSKFGPAAPCESCGAEPPPLAPELEREAAQILREAGVQP